MSKINNKLNHVKKKQLNTLARPNRLNVNGIYDDSDSHEYDFSKFYVAYIASMIALRYATWSDRYNHKQGTSYGLKHKVEHFVNQDHGTPYFSKTKKLIEHVYIPNGILILAAYHSGFKFKRVRQSPNCVFNFKLKLPQELSDNEADELNVLIGGCK